MGTYQQRTLDWVITKAFAHANRKGTAPAQGTPKYNVLTTIADSMQKLWADESGEDWDSLYQLTTLPTVVSATDTFAYDPSIKYLSQKADDYVKLVSPDGTQVKRYNVIRGNQLDLYRYQNAAAEIGRNLKFSQPFTSTSPELGYSIIVPNYTFVNDLANPTDLVQVDSPMWLAYMTAAEYVRNDSVRAAQYNNLLTLADEIMQKMKDANGGQLDAVTTEWAPSGESWV